MLKKCGLNVKKSYLVHINNKYVKNGELDINELFHIEDLTDILKLDEVESKVSELKEIINKKEEPNIDLSSHCHSPYDCPFFKYCTKNLPSPNVFDLGWGLSFDKKIDMYKRGSITFKDVLDKEKVNDKVLEQIKYTLNNLEPKINRESIKSFMSTLRYPLYFLDFESYQDSIPTIDGTKPYQQLCFQYSLHYLLEEDGELYHKEFLSDDYNGNPMYGLCKELCVDIPLDSCVLVYNQTFEKSRLNEMANMFPEFSEHLLNIKDNIIDLAVPFSKQDYYIKEMGGKYSIKYVLPALYPNDPTLDYHNLEQVHKGDEASNAYLSLKNLSKEEQDILRYNMLKYCELDTYAMVKIYEVLKQI